MNKRIVLGALLAVAVVLVPGTSHARWMNANTGRFMTMDSYEGDRDDPQSLHRYAYASDDPVNRIDPSGEDDLSSVLASISIMAEIGATATPAATQAQAKARAREAATLAKRKRIDEIARKYKGSKKWNYDVKKDNFPPNSNKCNKFVFDVTKEAGAEALVTVKGTMRPPLAADYADKSTKIPNWRPVNTDEKAEPGDIAAYKLEGGGTSFSGHSGFITSEGNISAHDDGVYEKPGQFENNPETRYRRYSGN